MWLGMLRRCPSDSPSLSLSLSFFSSYLYLLISPALVFGKALSLSFSHSLSSESAVVGFFSFRLLYSSVALLFLVLVLLLFFFLLFPSLSRLRSSFFFLSPIRYPIK
jgi:hypothetical protein